MATIHSPETQAASQGGSPSCLMIQSAMDFPDEHFRNSNEVFFSWAEMDFLEQFGTSTLKESNLRKQSLYLRFDPLLKDSPKQLVPVAMEETNNMPVTHRLSSENQPEAKLVDVNIVDALAVPVTGPTLCVLRPMSMSLSSDPMADVLQYSQEELNMEIKATQMKNLELKYKYKEVFVKCLEMETVMDGFELTVIQMMKEAQEQKKLAKAQIQKIQEEIDQLMSNLKAMDKSLSDLHKICKKQEEVIEDCQRTEESLMMSIEDYILRTKKMGQRYQALEAHIKEKQQLAKEELTQVQRQAQVEKLSFQVSLIKERVRILLLEKTLEQVTAENEELIRIHKDLTSQVEQSVLEVIDQ